MMNLLRLRLWMIILLLVTITITITITVTTGQQKQQQQQQRRSQRASSITSSSSSSSSSVEFVNPDVDPIKDVNLNLAKELQKDDEGEEDDPQSQTQVYLSLSQSLPLRKLQTNPNEIEIKGRFRVEYSLTGNADLPFGDIQTNDNGTKNRLQPVLDLIVDAYNTINVNDPQQRELVEPVKFVSGVILPPNQNNRSRRGLQQFGIARIIVDVVGRCNGCPADAPLTNQVSDGGRRNDKKKQRELTNTNHLRTLQQQVRPRGEGGGGGFDEESKQRRKKQRKLQGNGKGKGKGSNSNEGALNPDDDRETTPVPLPVPIFTPPPSPSPMYQLPTSPPTTSPTLTPTSPPTLLPTTSPTAFVLATEEQVRLEYSDIVTDRNDAVIQDVIDLEEIGFTCPSLDSSNNQGIPALSERIYYDCPRPLPSGFLVADNDSPGLWCLSTPSDSLGEYLHLQPCDFGIPQSDNNQAWTILDDSLHGGIVFQSTKYPNRCIGVGDYFDTPFLGDRLLVGACTVHTTFQFDFTQNYLKIPDPAGEEEAFCLSNEGITATSNRDALNAQVCPTQFDTDDDGFQWIFLFV